MPMRRPVLAAFAAANAAAAWGGAVALAAGAIDLGRRLDDRLPLASPVLAGVALALIVAVPLTALAWSAWHGTEHTDELALVAGTALIGWIAVQLVVLRAFSLFQPLYLAIGIALVETSHRIRPSPPRRGAILVLAGAVVTATGIGLAPHLVDLWSAGGSSLAAGVAAAALLGGIVLVVVGARTALRGRRLPGRLIGGASAVVVAGVVVWLVAPAIAATSVPGGEVTSTPDDVGLDYESVTLRTADEVELAGWFLPGSNGAGVVVLHGAGSTRSAVLRHAAVLVDAGYSALLVDARGHGDSGGTAMDLGWYGDLDAAAATAFLRHRPGIDRDRIGLVGMSMGGEEAIGAAASDPSVRAVVAEGATGRRAADKAWYSDAYGWRGWLQEWFETVQYGVVDLLTEASPPIALRTAVERAADTRFLLITAGEVADEARAAAHIRDAAPDRVALWTVEGAGHTDGLDTQPRRWGSVVVDFLDAALA
jgi:dienelactone hydrolase